MGSIVKDLGLKDKYPETYQFFCELSGEETMDGDYSIKGKYYPPGISDLQEWLSEYLADAFLNSPYYKDTSKYLRFVYNCHLTSTDEEGGFDNDGLLVTILNGLTIELGEDNDIAISYSKNDKQRFKHFYHYKGDFPKKTADDVKEELTTAIAIVDQLHEKITFKRTYEPKALLNPIRLSDTGIIVSFDKQTDGTTIVKAEKAEHTYGDGFTVTLSDTTTLKTINDVENDCVSQTICDTRVMTDFSQLHPLIEDVIRNIDSYQSKTID